MTMTKPLAALLFLTTLLGPAVLGDDLPRDWVKASDGFVWPATPKGVPVFKLKSLKWEDLEEGFQEFTRLDLQGHKEEAPVHVSLAEVDLNGDGRDEIFLQIPRFRGTGGSFFFIYTRTENGYQGIGHMQVVDVKFVEKKNGWYQIESSGRGGPMDYTRVLHTFEKEGYVMTRLEDHNFWKKTMIVKDVSEYR